MWVLLKLPAPDVDPAFPQFFGKPRWVLCNHVTRRTQCDCLRIDERGISALNFEWLPSFYHVPLAPLRYSEMRKMAGGGDKEPAPPPPCLPFAAPSPSLLVTNDYALPTGNQVTLFSCNSTAISFNLRRDPNIVHSMCPFDCVLHLLIIRYDSHVAACLLSADLVYTLIQSTRGCVYIHAT